MQTTKPTPTRSARPHPGRRPPPSAVPSAVPSTLAWGLLVALSPLAACYEPSKDTAPPYRLEPDTGRTGGDEGTEDTGIDPDGVPYGMVATVGGDAFIEELLIARVDAGYLFIEGSSADDVSILLDAVPGQLGLHPLRPTNPYASLTTSVGGESCVAGANGAPEGEINILRLNAGEVVATFRFDAGCTSGPVPVEGTVRAAL